MFFLKNINEEYLNLIPFFLFILSGISLVFISIFSIKNEKRKNVLGNYIKKSKLTDNFLDNWLNSKEFIESFEKENEKRFFLLNEYITPRFFTKLTLYSILGGVIFSVLIRNIIALPVAICIGYYLPQLYMDLLINNKKNKMEEQLGVAIKFFTTEFTTCRSVIISMQNVIPKLNNPIKGEFEKLARELNSGAYPKECLTNFGRRLDNKFSYVFSKLLIAYFNDGTDFGAQLVRLSEDIAEAQLQHKESRTELSMVRTTNLILNAIVFITVVVMFVFFPDYSYYFRATARGQFFMSLVIINSFVSILLGFKLSSI